MTLDRRITDEGDFTRLLQTLYAGVADVERMSDFLAELTCATHSHTAALQLHDAQHAQGQLLLTVGAIGMGSDEMLRYNETYAGDNVWMERGAALMANNGVASGAEIIAPAELKKTRFHRDYLQALDIEDSCAVLLWNGARGDVAVMSVNRSHSQGRFGDSERGLLKRLQPHLQNAYAIQRRLSWADQERRGLLSALEQLRFGVLLIDAYGRIRVANAMAGALLGGRIDIGQPLSITAGFHDEDAGRLRAAVHRATYPPLAAAQRLMLRNDSGEPELMAIVRALPVDGLADAGVAAARATVFLHPLRDSLVNSDREALLTELYGLSRVQARLACLLCGGMNLSQCAELLGNRMNTVKSQLKMIYQKTGTHRQGELVALLGELLRQ